MQLFLFGLEVLCDQSGESRSCGPELWRNRLEGASKQIGKLVDRRQDFGMLLFQQRNL